MSLEIKICGLSTPETLDAALGAGADMVGMVFFPPSPRHVDLATASALAARARGRAGQKVGIVALTVDADDAALADIIAAVRPDMLQLHGKETPGARRRHPHALQAAGDEGGRHRHRRRPRPARRL